MIDFSTLKALTIPEGDVKKIEIGGETVWELNLRDLYQRVEYITSAGGDAGGYFITDFIGNDQSGMEMGYSVTNFSDIVTMGSRISSATNTRFYIWYPMSSARGYYGWNTAVAHNVTTSANVKYIARLNWLNERYSRLLDGDGSVLSSKAISGTLTQQTVPVGIFRYNRADGVLGSRRPMSIYFVRFSQGSEIVREYFPCYRKSDGEIGLFETITGQFIPNAGGESTGFTKGPDIDWDF